MRQFDVKLSDQALEDADRVYEYIANEVFAPMTAALYYQGLLNKMHSLHVGADAISVDVGLSMIYGVPIRRINYKKLAILYSIEDDTVIIESILPQKMIK